MEERSDQLAARTEPGLVGPDRQSSIIGGLGELVAVLEFVTDRADRLEQRLNPVLTPGLAKTGTERDRATAPSDVGERIATLVDRLQRHSHHLDDLGDRVDL